MHTLRFCTLAFIAATALIAQTAHADEPLAPRAVTWVEPPPPPPNRPRLVAGVALTATGGLAVVPAGAFVALALTGVGCGADSGGGGGCGVAPELQVASVITASAAVGMLATGIVLLATMPKRPEQQTSARVRSSPTGLAFAF